MAIPMGSAASGISSAFEMLLQPLFQPLQARVHAVEALVNPLFVPEVLILALPGAVLGPAAVPVGVTVGAAFRAVTLASLPSLAPAGSVGVAPASSSHVVLLISRSLEHSNRTPPGLHLTLLLRKAPRGRVECRG